MVVEAVSNVVPYLERLLFADICWRKHALPCSWEVGKILCSNTLCKHNILNDCLQIGEENSHGLVEELRLVGVLQLVPKSERCGIHDMYRLVEAPRTLFFLEMKVVTEAYLLVVVEPLDVVVLLFLNDVETLYFPKLGLLPVKVEILPVAEIEKGERSNEFSFALSGNLGPDLLVVLRHDCLFCRLRAQNSLQNERHARCEENEEQ